MREHRLAVLTAASALALAVVGALVEPGGAAPASPDWPPRRGGAHPTLTGPVPVASGSAAMSRRA